MERGSAKHKASPAIFTNVRTLSPGTRISMGYDLQGCSFPQILPDPVCSTAYDLLHRTRWYFERNGNEGRTALARHTFLQNSVLAIVYILQSKSLLFFVLHSGPTHKLHGTPQQASTLNLDIHA